MLLSSCMNKLRGCWRNGPREDGALEEEEGQVRGGMERVMDRKRFDCAYGV